MNTPTVATGRSKAAKTRREPAKRILSVTVKRMVDDSPDTSWMGEYSSKATSRYAIAREHDEDCPRFWANDDIPDDARDCDCHNLGHRELPYFNPPNDNYKGEPDSDIRKYCLQDYRRAESLNCGLWCFIGVRAEAEVWNRKTQVVQKISSGGLWGIESDSPDYIAEQERNQLDALRAELGTYGFSVQAISHAFKDVKHLDA